MIKLNSAFSAVILVSALLLSPLSQGSGQDRQPEQILNQELLLNQLITSIHILQLDFLDQDIREELQEQLVQLDANFKAWPQASKDSESNDLLMTVKSLWPVIKRHINWLSDLPKQSRPPEANSLLRALGKLDRQLMLLRQKYLSSNPAASRKYRFLEQALMMQRLTRQYLSLALTNKQTEDMSTKKSDLQSLAAHFSQRLNTIQEALAEHPHAGQPLKQSVIAWQYISNSIEGFPSNQVPLMIVRYGNRIVSKLSSVQRMF